MNAYKPRVYQRECIKALSKARAEGENKALIVMASGLGKTITSAFDIVQYFKSHRDGRVLVLCHSQAIQYQTKKYFKKVFGDEYSYGMYNGVEKASTKTDFLFANLQSVNIHKDEFAPDEFSYCIVDEAHHSPAETYKKAIQYFKPQFLLGMTATPERTDAAGLEDIFGKTVFEYRLESAIRDGWLSDLDYHVLTDEIQNLQQFLDTEVRISLSQLNRKVFVPKRDEEIVRIIKEELSHKKDPTTVIFCQTIEHAERFAELMGDAVVIHSKLDDDTVRERLEGFYSGSIKTVCAVDMLNEGIDVPRTDVIVFLRVTQSKIVFTQQLGRGLRLAENKGKVLVLDFVGAVERFCMLCQLQKELNESISRYPHRKIDEEHEFFNLEIDTPVFRDRKVDIIELIEKARNYVGSYSNDELLQLLKEFGIKLGHTPSIMEVNADPDMPNATTYANHFGSFVEACLLAGFELKPNNKRYSDKELLDFLCICAERVGHVPTSKDLNKFPDMPSAVTYRNRFGGLMAATEKAGLGKSRGAYDLSDDEMANLYLEFANELGRRPNSEEIKDNPKLPSPGCYRNRFGSIGKLGDSLGLPRAKNWRYKKYSNDWLLKKLVDFAEKIGHTPTTIEIAQLMLYQPRFHLI